MQPGGSLLSGAGQHFFGESKRMGFVENQTSSRDGAIGEFRSNAARSLSGDKRRVYVKTFSLFFPPVTK